MLGFVLGIVSFAVLVFIVIVVLVAPSGRKHEDLKLVDGKYIAHRGLHDDEAPENSLLSFEKACEKGLAIENDIHLTADGEVVVFHDPTLTRMCGDDRTIEDMTLAEIKELRLSGTEEKIPTLKECLDTVAGRTPILIEFKCGKDAAPLCEKANEILKDYNGKYLVQSFSPYVLEWYRKNRPDVCRGLLAVVIPKKNKDYLMLSCMFWNIIARPDFVSYEKTNKKFFFRRLTTVLGAFPIAWTVRSEEEVENAKDEFRTMIFENYMPKNLETFRD